MWAGLSASGNGAIWAMTTFLESISMVWKLMRGAGAMAVRAMLAILDSREAMSETPTTVRSTDPSSTPKITVATIRHVGEGEQCFRHLGHTACRAVGDGLCCLSRGDSGPRVSALRLCSA